MISGCQTVDTLIPQYPFAPVHRYCPKEIILNSVIKTKTDIRESSVYKKGARKIKRNTSHRMRRAHILRREQTQNHRFFSSVIHVNWNTDTADATDATEATEIIESRNNEIEAAAAVITAITAIFQSSNQTDAMHPGPHVTATQSRHQYNRMVHGYTINHAGSCDENVHQRVFSVFSMRRSGCSRCMATM